jgi:hypothetical protein
MASPFQQQVRLRKFLYIGLIVVLFTVSIVWRKAVIDNLAGRLAIREESRGDVELLGSFVRLSLTGSRGLVTCILWDSAIDKQKKNQWNQLEVIVDSLTRLQPHFTTPWLFQSWNLSYNVSVESDRVRDKYYYMSRGIDLLARGERQNHNHPDLRWSIGFYTQHKICQSDETNYIRSLFQLSIIPPGERDPARFWKQSPTGPEFDWLEFEKFCGEHPQLVRRLHHGVHKDTAREKKRLFTCENPEDVVQFLDDNFSVPSMYVVRAFASDSPAQERGWAATKDTLLAAENRFPILPPQHTEAFDSTALSSDSTLRDDTDGFAAAHSWYCYAQEPLPKPGPLPGSSEEITEPARQRRPKKLTTLLFRHYPPMGLRYMAERLQAEGWFDGEGWNAKPLFSKSKEPGHAGKEFLFGKDVKWSGEAWARAKGAWTKHGTDNHLIFPSPSAEQNERDLAKRFADDPRHRIQLYSSPPQLAEGQLSAEEAREYQAAKFMYEYEFYRTLTNFKHHFIRSIVEALPETIQCRKHFYKAEQANLDGSPFAALSIYKTPVVDFGGGKPKLDPLTAWREILFQNKEFRRDSFIQEGSAEIQTKYLFLWNRYPGRALKDQLVKLAPLLPLVPRFDPVTLRLPITEGPFDVNDNEGVPLIDPELARIVLERMGIRKGATTPPPGTPLKRIDAPDGPAPK